MVEDPNTLEAEKLVRTFKRRARRGSGSGYVGAIAVGVHRS